MNAIQQQTIELLTQELMDSNDDQNCFHGCQITSLDEVGSMVFLGFSYSQHNFKVTREYVIEPDGQYTLARKQYQGVPYYG